MADLVVKRNDTWPAVKFKLTQVNPETQAVEPINLSTALKVTLWLKNGATLIEGVCTGPAKGALDATGQCEYLWATGDTKLAGTYEAEAEIEWSATHIETVPNEGHRTIEIQPDLPNA